ncbi:MAG: hypothetical protein IT172_08535 [Acidobacteria bacterium]|nr:hypothetical protein [Acidobacteriota bacterium]
MLVRAIALSMALLVGIGVIVPLSTDNVEAGPRKHKKHRKVKRYRKYSKAWWRQYRAKQRKRAAARKKARALRLRQLRLARAAAASNRPETRSTKPPKAAKAAKLPNGKSAPEGWTASSSSPAELRFRVEDSAGSQVGNASISVIGPATGESVNTPRQKAVGGVATTALRRDVINKMIQENGWVVNDYQKEIGGRQVYVVVAQSQNRSGQIESRMYYFTEVDGRIYSVATNSPVDQEERLAAESEKVIDSLQNRVRGVQRASTRE